MNRVADLLALPLGTQLSSDNRESFVYELGEHWVYKEIKTEHNLPPDTKDYEHRVTLQRYWCSDTHYENTLRDFSVIVRELKEWIPETFITKAPARFSGNPNAAVVIQRKIKGQLLSEQPNFTSHSLTHLIAEADRLSHIVFDAPLDVHSGNIMIEQPSGNVFLFDTGTPSDWKYFLNERNLQEAIDIDDQTAKDFVKYMTTIYHAHWERLRLVGQ